MLKSKTYKISDEVDAIIQEYAQEYEKSQSEALRDLVTTCGVDFPGSNDVAFLELKSAMNRIMAREIKR